MTYDIETVRDRLTYSCWAAAYYRAEPGNVYDTGMCVLYAALDVLRRIHKLKLGESVSDEVWTFANKYANYVAAFPGFTETWENALVYLHDDLVKALP